MDISSCTHCNNSSTCFKKLLSKELNFIDQNKVQTTYHKGETLCKTGTLATTIIYIIDGLVKVYLEGSDKKNLGVLLLKSGDYIGLTSLYGTKAYYYTATALSETKICSIKKDSFKNVIEQNSQFAAEIVKWYCINYGMMFEKLGSIGFKQLNGRIADVLLDLNEIEFSGKNIHTFLTRKDLADMAGLPIGSAIRILSELSDAKIIELKNKEIKILNPTMLQKISRGG